MSEEIASADSLLTENAQLRKRILEWEDAYDRLSGAFDLHMAILECNGALADLAGGYYDVVLGALAKKAERAETARRAWTELGAKAEADAGALRTCLLSIRTDAAEYGPEPQGITKGYVWAGALLRQIDDVLNRHPAGVQLLTDLEAQHKALDAAYHALQSYAHGNSAPALAEEVAAHILATIEKVSG